MRRIAPVGVCVAAFLLLSAGQAAGGPLDPSFGEGGRAITPAASGVVTDLVEDRQRRLVAAGVSYGGFVLARYAPDGTLDQSFTGGFHPSPGVVRTELDGGGGAYSVAVQSDGRIVVAGAAGPVRESNGVALIRYLPDGGRDPGFGTNGLVKTRLGHLAGAGRAMALQRNGRIVVGGFVGPLKYPGVKRRNPSGLLIRYLPDGSADRSFGKNGQLRVRASGGGSVTITDVVALANGKILAAGNYGGRLLLIRLLPDGRFDASFGGGDGRTMTQIGRNECEACPATSSLALADNGKILLAGSTGGRSAVVAYRTNGGIDRGFGSQGLVKLRKMGFFGAARDVIVAHDDRIVVAGGTEFGLRVMRFLPDGKPDRSFARSGVYSRGFGNFSQACAVLQQAGGRLVVGGRADRPPVSVEAEGDLSDAQFLLFGLRG